MKLHFLDILVPCRNSLLSIPGFPARGGPKLPARMAQGPTSLAHACFLCPRERSVARSQIDCGGGESAVHLMPPQMLSVWYIGTHHWIGPVPVFIFLGFTCLLLARDLCEQSGVTLRTFMNRFSKLLFNFRSKGKHCPRSGYAYFLLSAYFR